VTTLGLILYGLVMGLARLVAFTGLIGRTSITSPLTPAVRLEDILLELRALRDEVRGKHEFTRVEVLSPNHF